VSLLDRVAAVLDGAGARYAVIGASAMAAHGVARSTHDIDLLTLADACLDAELWARLADAGVKVSVNRGDSADPLAGVVRFEEAGRRPVDLVVGRHRWQIRMLERAEPAIVHGSRVPAVQARDLIALKLFAGGAQDAWDVVQLLAGPDRETLIGEVAADVGDLPAQCRGLWERILADAAP
jgi:predicted nucleotidyltransferase